MFDDGEQTLTAREEPIDFLGSRPNAKVESVRQLIEAQNVLASYSHSIDLLAEAIQNAMDAIDARSERDSHAPRRLEIRFDAKDRSFVVTDTGTGLSRDSLGMVLTPNVTLKQGGLAKSRQGRSRGEKGVGLTFLVLACDRFAIQTCDGEERWDVTVSDAGAWVRSDGEVPVPRAFPKQHQADSLAGSERYTAVSVSGVSKDQFDDDLFSRTLDQLIWELRTRTAIGNTAVLFEALGRPQPLPVEVVLTYRSASGEVHEPVNIEYGYATPEALLGAAELRIVDYEEFIELSDEEQDSVTRGGAMRYVYRFETASARIVDMYLFAIDGNEMRSRKAVAESEGRWFPDDWTGMFVATRDMPTGIHLPSGSIPQRTYERRLFVLLQYDELKLDLGRKTLAGRTPAMLKAIVRAAWDEDLKYVVPRFDRMPSSANSVSVAALRNKILAARRAPDLESTLPYLKEPSNAGGVAAVFHEMLPLNGVVPSLRTLASAVFASNDALLHRVSDDADRADPIHVVFAVRPTDLLAELDREDRLGTVGLGVVWTLEDNDLSQSSLTTRPAPSADDGATHELVLRGVAGRESLRLIVLDSLLAPT